MDKPVLPYRAPVDGRKGRYNVSLTPSVVREMDAAALKLGCSRSELIEYCFHYSVFASEDLRAGVSRG